MPAGVLDRIVQLRCSRGEERQHRCLVPAQRVCIFLPMRFGDDIADRTLLEPGQDRSAAPCGQAI